MESYYNFDEDKVVSTGTWFMISIVSRIPLINLIFMLFLVFGGGNQNLRNYGKASLMRIAVGLVFAVIIVYTNSIIN